MKALISLITTPVQLPAVVFLAGVMLVGAFLVALMGPFFV